MTVYLLHFDRPYKHAKHYLGYTKNLARRLERHRKGDSARLIQVIKDAGISWNLARVWMMPRGYERYLKDHYKNSPKLCPICNPSNFRKGPANVSSFHPR